jgi:3',5'-nucleoside bisphosphate phosphatase
VANHSALGTLRGAQARRGSSVGPSSSADEPWNARRSALADLHLHTIHSDGRLAPAAVVETAAAQCLATIAIVDHDVVTGLPEALDAGQRLGVDVIPGIELTARWRGRTCHVLGYDLDPSEPRLLAALQQARAAAEAAVAAGLQALRARGHELVPADLARYHARYPTPTTLLLAAVQRRLLRSRADVLALARALRAGASPMTVPQAIALIHGAGGATVLAHPGRRVGRIPLDRAALAELSAQGLDGVEVEHPAHTPEQRATYAGIARDLDLVATGGSDWHGRPRDLPPGTLGTGAFDLAALRGRAARAYTH